MVAFKGVFLEGLEVVIIVLTLGTTSGNLGLAALAAGSAVVVVGLAGLILARQLSSVPENAMKMGVGLMLVSFGTFWSGEGVGVHWPGSDLAIPVLVGCVRRDGMGAGRDARPRGVGAGAARGPAGEGPHG